jgi:hypothetical protein
MSSTVKLPFFIFLILFASCKSDQKTSTESTVANKVALPPPAETQGPEIPGVPKDVMVKLLNECTYIDYIFHKLPFSISQSEEPGIDQNISFIDINKPLVRVPKDCKAIGRKFFHIKGEIVYDVDVYLDNKCKFYVFVDKKNKPIYANYMTDAALQFYSNIAQQARGVSQQQQ